MTDILEPRELRALVITVSMMLRQAKLTLSAREANAIGLLKAHKSSMRRRI